MKRLLLSIALSAAFSSPAPAQTAATPDLSGTWKLNLAKSKLPKKLPTKAETIRITTDGDAIQFHFSGDPKNRVYTFVPDGKVRTVYLVEGKRRLGWGEDPVELVKARWEKSFLVIEYDVKSGLDPADPVDSMAPWPASLYWSVSIDGKTLTEKYDGSNWIRVYDKQ
jgi:hypothetical protein